MSTKKNATALCYPLNSDAPFILANTKGLLAEKVIEIAKENDIPIKEDKVLSEVLSLCDVGTCVPEETYEALAKIFAFIIENEKSRTKYYDGNKKANR